MVEARLDYRQFNPQPLQALLTMEKYIAGCGLEHKCVHLLKLRASQINGCAYCIDMHSIDARAAGETEHCGHHKPCRVVFRAAPKVALERRGAGSGSHSPCRRGRRRISTMRQR